MTALTINDLLAALRSAVQGLEARSDRDAASTTELERVKLGLDELRLSLWAHLQRAHQDDLVTFEQRFRVRRATEFCTRLRADLDAHLLDGSHPEFADLWIVTNELGAAIQAAQRRASGGRPQ